MGELAVNRARKNFSDAINRVVYAKERIVLTRRRKGVAALVPVEDLELLEKVEDRLDVRLARKALAEARRKSEKPIPLEVLKKELGL
jgi:prevent-host-death family protein